MKKCLAFLLIAIPYFSFAWGSKGHKIVASLAYDVLDKKAQDSVQKYLGSTTIEQAGTWMDDVRSDASYNYMKPWHYIDIDKNQTIDEAPKPNVITELTRVTNELKNRRNISKDQIEVDLKVLFHLIGDLHQPLHVGYGTDRGGNLVHVKIGNTQDNLHHLWDDVIIEQNNITLNSCYNQYKSLSPQQIKNIQNGNFINWLNESRSYLAQVYAFQGNEITQEYITSNAVIVNNQLVYGALRLSKILQEIFG